MKSCDTGTVPKSKQELYVAMEGQLLLNRILFDYYHSKQDTRAWFVRQIITLALHFCIGNLKYR